MIIVAYLTENFIRETLKLETVKLRIFLESLCVWNEYLFFIFEPNIDLGSIKKKKPKDANEGNITLWKTYLRNLHRLGRVKEHQFIKDYYRNNDLQEGIYKEAFIKKALKEKVFYLSFKEFYIKKSYLKMESLGRDTDEIKFKIDCLLKENVEPTQDIKNIEDRENLFFDKIGGFCCFYNTIIWIDRYILDNKKNNPTTYLKTPIRLLNGSKVKNLIILTSDPYAENPKKNKLYKNKEVCIKQYLNNLKEAFYPNNIDIYLFFLIPKELKKIHSRFVSWTSLPNSEDFDFTSLKGLEDQLKLAIQPDKGAGYFEEDSKQGFSAQFSYPSSKVVNSYMSKIINCLPKEGLSIEDDKKDESYKYWIKEKYPPDRGWIYYKDIFKKAKVNQ